MSFALHPRLQAGSSYLGTTGGCRILLKNNAAFPWMMIVPEVEDGIEDLHQLPPEQFAEVAFLIRTVSGFVEEYFGAEKINVGCLGNVVRQMHLHIIGRFESDPAWPGTVWASDAKAEYSAGQIESIRNAARLHFKF